MKIGNDTLAAIIVLIGFISSIRGTLAAYLAEPISDKITARNTSMTGFFAAAVFYIAASVLFQNIWTVIILASIAQFFLNMTYSANVAMYADRAIYSRYKTGTESTGLIMGLSNVPLEAAVITRDIIITALLASVGFSVATIDPSTTALLIQQGTSTGFALIPGIMQAIGGILILFAYRLTRKKVTEYSAKIQECEEVQTYVFFITPPLYKRPQKMSLSYHVVALP